MAAFDARTGTELWRVARDEGIELVDAVRLAARAAERRSSRPARRKVRSYDTNGKLLWELRGMTSIHMPTPFAIHGLLFV